MKIYKKYFVVLLLLTGQKAYCQRAGDTTAAFIKEFAKLMSATAQPYLYYSMVTKANAEPVILAADTITTNGIFYKNQNDIYYKNGEDEMYIEDSFKIQINHQRKTIWINKIDAATKEKMTFIPINNKEFKSMLQKKFTISKSILNDSTAELNFTTIQNKTVTTAIAMDYINTNYLLKHMNITVRIQEPAGDDIVAALKSEGVDESKLIQTIDSVKYLVRKQILNITFEGIDTKKETAMQMPNWKDVVVYDAATKTFTTKETYREYAITKLF